MVAIGCDYRSVLAAEFCKVVQLNALVTKLGLVKSNASLVFARVFQQAYLCLFVLGKSPLGFLVACGHQMRGEKVAERRHVLNAALRAPEISGDIG